MRKNMYLFALVVVFIFTNCSSTPNNSLILRTNSIFINGSTGRGLTIAVLEPNSLLADSNSGWIPIYIQSVLTNNFHIFSEMTIIDRQNIDRILEEQRFSLSGIFSDDDFIGIGHIINAHYILIGNLINISNSEISLQLAITNTETGERLASFFKNVTVEDIQNTAVINEASVQLLYQIGVELSTAGIEKLLSYNINTIRAETALAKGISAQNRGSIVEAMSYYTNARNSNSQLREASNRLSRISANVRTGNIGNDVRNEIQRRNAWLDIINEAELFFSTHSPYEIIYNPELRTSNINYRNETVDLSFRIQISPSTGWGIIREIFNGLRSTGKRKEWGLGGWPITPPYERFYHSHTFTDWRQSGGDQDKLDRGKWMQIEVSLINQNNIVLARNSYRFLIRINDGRVWNLDPPSMVNIRNYRVETLNTDFTFNGINANNITDKLTIRFDSVDGFNLLDNDYIMITTTNRRI